MFARRPKHGLGTMVEDKGFLVGPRQNILWTKAAQSKPDSQRNRNCTKKLQRNVQLRLRLAYDMFELSPGSWLVEMV
jgi:hypothetical protein